MNNITDLEAVKNWAKETVAGEGRKFTALSKTDQYEIAKAIILAYGEGNDESDTQSQEESPNEVIVELPHNPEADILQMPGAEEQQQAEEQKQEEQPQPDPCVPLIPAAEEEIDRPENPAEPKIETRYHFYHRQKYLPQAVYDEFTKYCETHPQEKFVMDFNTGVKSSMAAFAYWLSGEMGEELTQPPKPKAKDIMNDWD